jgi:hypothetical protein
MRVLPLVTEIQQGRKRRLENIYISTTLKKTHDVVGVVEFPEGMNHRRVGSSPKRLPQLP